MKNPPPPPLHSRYPPRKLLLLLLSNTHPGIGVMGNTKSITLYNKTKEVVDIIDFRGIITGKTVKAGGQTDINPKEYDGDDSRGGRLPLLMIFCGGSLLKSPKGDFLIAGEEFFSTCFKTVTIDQPNDQNSNGDVNYKVMFEPQHAYRKVTVNPLEFSRDQVLDHDNGWSVQFINGNVKLTRKEGVTMILDPSKLFSTNIVDDPETSLLCMVLNFWPRTFADLKCKDDLVGTVRVVNGLMVQAKKYNVDRPEGADAEVMKNVVVLNKLCAATVEWYRPLFPWMVGKFPPVAKVDQEKLKKFETIIKPLLNPFLGRSSGEAEKV
ncbi:hypothetical protein RHSIM_RhsimUnG0038400 [Rhododendron simsii]|uniref:Uncharacterized protein n=1 Tax=Rhododendron simsii TaxID=118357 RepID=A0A834L5L2_RHOSS|nr:hypothetical protein RHSIM_RhsimUnG0038400 [Rhododendron simsii]